MPDKFLDQVRKSRVPQPTQRNFDLQKWYRAYKESKSQTKKDDKIFKAGIWFFNKFETICDISIDIDLHSISKDKLVLYIVGDLNITCQSIRDRINQHFESTSKKLDNNKALLVDKLLDFKIE